MQLSRIKYRIGSPIIQNEWKLNSLELGNINLIVGKNATGKTRVAQLISSTAKMISEQTSFYGEWELTFSDPIHEIEYEISNNGTFNHEKITSNGKVVLLREQNKTLIFSFKEKKLIRISPPDNKLVLHIRRDKEEFPFLDYIVEWAEQTYGFKFGNISPYLLLIDRDTDRLTSIDEIPSLFDTLEKSVNGKKHIKKILNEFNSLGYNVKEIETRNGKQGVNTLYLLEEHLKESIPQSQLSQGMFRSLSLLIFLEYLQLEKKVSTIIVDDLCEGLDYDRAIKFGKLLVKKLENMDVQFIATSNDNFLMDIFPIRYWNILTRKDSVIKSFNYQNSKEKFDNFMFKGLSNFDLFSSNYLYKK